MPHLGSSSDTLYRCRHSCSMATWRPGSVLVRKIPPVTSDVISLLLHSLSPFSITSLPLNLLFLPHPHITVPSSHFISIPGQDVVVQFRTVPQFFFPYRIVWRNTARAVIPFLFVFLLHIFCKEIVINDPTEDDLAT